MNYSRVTRLSSSQVIWNHVQGSTKVGSQLSRTLFGSFTALLNANRASPVRFQVKQIKQNENTIVIVTRFLRKYFSLPSEFAFTTAKGSERRKMARTLKSWLVSIWNLAASRADTNRWFLLFVVKPCLILILILIARDQSFLFLQCNYAFGILESQFYSARKWYWMLPL